MRKQDRINQPQSQNPSGQQPSPQPHPDEKMTGKADDQPNRPPRPGGKLPLPD